MWRPSAVVSIESDIWRLIVLISGVALDYTFSTPQSHCDVSSYCHHIDIPCSSQYLLVILPYMLTSSLKKTILANENIKAFLNYSFTRQEQKAKLDFLGG